MLHFSNAPASKSNYDYGEINRASWRANLRSRIVVVKLVVLDRVDEAERQRLAGVLCKLEQPPNRFAPAKKHAVAKRFIGVLFRQAVGIDNRGVIAD